MKIIVATNETQGQRSGDFNFVPDGEVVMVSDCDCLHAGCDCVRSMVGIKSGKGTTTMKVVESAITLGEYRRLIGKANQGYGELGVDDEIFNEQADALLDLAMQFPAGAVIERDGENFQQRQISK
ncbi:MAG TPA: hypothetical protein VJ464_23625 [Blastocatellia bacterium]|nr:hypothetical protein [Blastocatellia bacterium]